MHHVWVNLGTAFMGQSISVTDIPHLLEYFCEKHEIIKKLCAHNDTRNAIYLKFLVCDFQYLRK